MPLTLRNDTLSRDESATLPSTSLVRCTQCGKSFQCYGQEATCDGCRKPKTSCRLSFRERQIVNLVKQAKANKEIAYELQLSGATVKEYLNRIYRKLELRSRTELAIWAFAAASDCPDTYHRILKSTIITASLARPGIGAIALGHAH